MNRAVLALLSTSLAMLALAIPAHAQTSGRRVAFDTVIGTQDVFAETRAWPTQVVIDPFVEVQIRRGLSGSVRAKVWRVEGDWLRLLDQAAIRYDVRARTRWRIEAGRFASPIGYGMTENRPNLNAGVLWCHRPYYMPLPLLSATLPMVSLPSAVYPNGVHVSTSATHWDARVAMVDRAPVEFWHGESRGSRSPHLIVGGGVTPVPGARVGISVARGRWVKRSLAEASSYDLVNVEGEYAIGYTKISGEWSRTTLSVGAGHASASGVTLQAQRTLAPKWFVHNRTTTMKASAAIDSAAVRTFWSSDSTIGYRVDPDVTIRAGHSAVKGWAPGAPIDHQFTASLMWAHRWW